MNTKTLKTSVKFCIPNLGFESKDDQSFCAEGAMLFLCAGVDSDIIKLIGCWYSNEIIRYLFVQTEPIMINFSKLMVMDGNYYLLPQKETPCF